MSVDLRRPTLFLCSCKYKYIKEQGWRTVLKASRRWRFKGWLCLGHVCCILVRKLGLMLLPITVLFCILVNLGVGLSADRGRLFFCWFCKIRWSSEVDCRVVECRFSRTRSSGAYGSTRTHRKKKPFRTDTRTISILSADSCSLGLSSGTYSRYCSTWLPKKNI